MRKTLSLLLVSIICLGMFGCSGSKSTTTVCKLGEGTMNESTITLNAKGDKVTSAEYLYVVNYASYGYTDEQMLTSIDQGKAEYADVAGVNYDARISDGILHETVSIDYDKADMAQLVSKRIVVSVDGKTPAFVGLKVTVDELTSKNGASCTEK